MMRIASAQSPIMADPRQNGEHIRALMRMAHAAGARLAHFPEGALSGYVKSEIQDWNEVDWGLVQRELDLTTQVSAELGIWTVLGSNHRWSSSQRPHNSLIVISDKGEVHARYDKRCCSFTELTDWYTPGRSPVVFEVDGVRFGCAICFEVQFPELFLEYERLDVDCVLYSAYTDEPMFGLLARAHAETTCMWVSVSNPAQCSGPGGVASCLIGPDGEVIASCREEGDAAIALADLDRNDPRFDVALNQARPWRREIRVNYVGISA